MATIRTVTLPDGSTFTMSDWGDYPLFSRAEIDASNAQDIITFNYTQSQKIPGSATSGTATLMDSNVPTASQLPLRHQMVIFSVQVRFDEIDTFENGTKLSQALWGQSTDALAAFKPDQALGLNKFNIFSQNVYLVLLVENVKPYAEGPLTQFPHGGGLYYNKPIRVNFAIASPPSPIPVALSPDTYTVQNGEPGTHAARRLAMPVHLGALEQFQGLLKYPRGAINFGSAGFVKPTDRPNLNDVVGKIGVNMGLFGPRQRPIG